MDERGREVADFVIEFRGRVDVRIILEGEGEGDKGGRELVNRV